MSGDDMRRSLPGRWWSFRSRQLGGEIRGIGVLRAGSVTEAEEWIRTDPMLKVGRLRFEVHAWMIAKGVLP